MSFQLIKIFPENIGIYKLTYNKKEEEFLKKFTFAKTIDSKNKQIAEEAYISKDLYILNKNNTLKNKLLNCVNKFMKDTLRFSFEVQITTSWLTKTLPNGFSQEHNHTLSFYSGVYYPFKTDNLYKINFLKKDYDFFQTENYVKDFTHINNNAEFSVPYGTLLIFNSKLRHKVPRNNTNEVRYSLAFNTMPKGLLGSKNSDSQYDFK